MPKAKKSPGKGIHSRSLSLRFDAGGRPASLDEEGRSVDVVGATEAPTPIYDWDSGQVMNEVLLMAGCRLPDSGRCVLLDTHSRYGTSSVVGSYRDLRVEGGTLVGKAVFSSTPDGDGPFTKLKEGHLTDFSVGYRPRATTRVKAGQTAVVEGRSYTGPLLVTTDWELRELSICPIGADPNAKARSEASEEDPMDERLRQYLEKNGLRADADEAAAWAFLAELEARGDADPPGQADANPGQDANQGQRSDPAGSSALENGRAEGMRLERQRADSIRSMCEQFGCADLVESLIRDGKTEDQARAAVLERLSARAKEQRPGFGVVVMGVHESEKFRAAAIDSLCLRAGIRIEKPAVGAEDLRGFQLRELAREALRMAGERAPSNVMDMVGRAMTSSDFPLLLANVANKSLADGWDTSEETYQLWVDDSGSVSDFKIHTAVRPGETDDLDEIGEGGEYKYGSRSEAQETYRVAKYGKLFAITREAVINDDLSALTDIPKNHGEAAQRKVGDVVYAVLIANPAMGDGLALFHAKHSNLLTGAALSVDALGTGETAMGKQRDISGKRRLNIKAAYYIAPVTLRTKSEQFFSTQLIGLPGTANQPNMSNPYYGDKIVRVYEPRLDDDSIKAWYLAARKGKTVKLYWLQGVKTPYLETKQGWSVDGVEYKVRIEVGAKAQDWRGMSKNPGE